MNSPKCSKGHDLKLPCWVITALSLAVDRAEGQKELVDGSFQRPKTTQIRNGGKTGLTK